MSSTVVHVRITQQSGRSAALSLAANAKHHLRGLARTSQESSDAGNTDARHVTLVAEHDFAPPDKGRGRGILTRQLLQRWPQCIPPTSWHSASTPAAAITLSRTHAFSKNKKWALTQVRLRAQNKPPRPVPTPGSTSTRVRPEAGARNGAGNDPEPGARSLPLSARSLPPPCRGQPPSSATSPAALAGDMMSSIAHGVCARPHPVSSARWLHPSARIIYQGRRDPVAGPHRC